MSKSIRTVSDLAASDAVLLTASEVGAVLGIHPQTLNLKAKNGDLPFPYIRSGNRTKIPPVGADEMVRNGDETMKTINGIPCRKLKTAMGRVYWIRMTTWEVVQVIGYRTLIVLTPIVTILLFAWAGGML